MIRTHQKTRKGFTLIELIIVITILAILSVMAVPQLIRYVESANISNDDMLSSLLIKSVMLLMAEDNISMTGNTGTITVGKSGGEKLEYIASGNITIKKGTVQSQMESLVGETAQIKYYQQITVTLTHIYKQDGGSVVSVTSAYTIPR